MNQNEKLLTPPLWRVWTHSQLRSSEALSVPDRLATSGYSRPRPVRQSGITVRLMPLAPLVERLS